MPSLLLEGLNLTAVDFPPCKLTSFDYSNLFCYYELHRMNKFIWSNLKTHAITLYNAIERITFNQSQLMTLAQHYNSYPTNTSIDQIACSWVDTYVSFYFDT